MACMTYCAAPTPQRLSFSKAVPFVLLLVAVCTPRTCLVRWRKSLCDATNTTNTTINRVWRGAHKRRQPGGPAWVWKPRLWCVSAFQCSCSRWKARCWDRSWRRSELCIGPMNRFEREREKTKRRQHAGLLVCYVFVVVANTRPSTSLSGGWVGFWGEGESKPFTRGRAPAQPPLPSGCIPQVLFPRLPA